MSAIITSKNILVLPDEFRASTAGYNIGQEDKVFEIVPIDNISLAAASHNLSHKDESEAHTTLHFGDGQHRTIFYRVSDLAYAQTQHANLQKIITEKTGQSLIQITKSDGRLGGQYINPAHVEGFFHSPETAKTNPLLTVFMKGMDGVRVEKEFQGGVRKEIEENLPVRDVVEIPKHEMRLAFKPHSLQAVWSDGSGPSLLTEGMGKAASIPVFDEQCHNTIAQLAKAHPDMIGFTFMNGEDVTAFYAHPKAIKTIGIDGSALYVTFTNGAKPENDKKERFEVSLFTDDAKAKGRALIRKLSMR